MTTPTNKQVRLAAAQLEADFAAAKKEFCLTDQQKADTYRAFCLGTIMCILTLKEYVEKPTRRPEEEMDVESSVEALYNAAKRTIHSD